MIGVSSSAAPIGGLAALTAKLTGASGAKVACGVLAVCLGGAGVHQVARPRTDAPPRSPPTTNLVTADAVPHHEEPPPQTTPASAVTKLETEPAPET